MSELDLWSMLFVFMLATFIGFEVIRNVSRLLHTPLMSLTNAISAIAVVGSILLAGEKHDTLTTVLGTVAVAASMTNIVSGFLITDRMLKMFKKREGPNAVSRRWSSTSSRRLPPGHRALRLLAQVALAPGDGAARRLRRRLRHERRRSSARSLYPEIVDYTWILVALVVGTADRRAALARAAHRGAAADGALARLRRPRRRPRRHRQVLPLAARARRSSPPSAWRDRPRGAARLPDLHRLADGGGQAAGDPADRGRSPTAARTSSTSRLLGDRHRAAACMLVLDPTRAVALPGDRRPLARCSACCSSCRSAAPTCRR